MKFMVLNVIFMHHVHLGATINDETIPQLKAKVIAGSANNQLKDTSSWRYYS